MWDSGLRMFHDTNFFEMLDNVIEHIDNSNYSKIIVTNFEAGFDLDDEQKKLQRFFPEVYDYMYGWEREEVESWGDRIEGKDFCDGGSHSEVVLIDEWMHNLEGEIDICGAFDGECIEDLEIALQGAGKEFNRLEHLIV